MKIIYLIDQRDIDNLVDYVSYKMQRAMYDYMEAATIPMTWSEFTDVVRASERMQTILTKTLSKPIRKCSISSFDFAHTEEPISFFDEPHKRYSCVTVFSAFDGRQMIIKLMLKVEIAYYLYLLKKNFRSRKFIYTWNQFCIDVINDKEKLTVLKRAFLNRIINISYEDAFCRIPSKDEILFY